MWRKWLELEDVGDEKVELEDAGGASGASHTSRAETNDLLLFLLLGHIP